jgi:hypothetical protein
MLQRFRSKLTYPYLVSTLALFVALGGGAYALDGKNTVNSGDVKNNTLTSKDQKDGKGTKGVDVTDNSLKGADVDESSLSQVPSAANANNANHANNADNADNATNAANATQAANSADADHADQADNATTVNSVAVQAVRYRTNATTNTPTQIVTLGGLTLTANCNGGNLSLVANTSTSNASISSAAIDTFSDVVDANTVHDNDFDTGDTVDLLAADDNDQVLNVEYTRPASGGFLSQSAATSAVLMTDSDGGVDCLVTGHAFRNGGGFPLVFLP